MPQQSIVLIGMPGAGKSTVGILLAKELGLDFVDTDIVIQVKLKMSLQHILEQRGYLELRKIEEQVILDLRLSSAVIATGGSAVYGSLAMNHLKSHASVIFIDVPLAVLYTRITNFDSRGIARRNDQSFEDLFEERHRLYCKYADIRIPGRDLPPAEIVSQIIHNLKA